MKKRLLAFLLAAVLVLPFFVACNGAGSNDAETTVPDSTPELTVTITPDTTGTPDTTEPPETTEPDNSVILAPDAIAGYRIVIPKNASLNFHNGVKELANAIGAAFGCDAPAIEYDDTEPTGKEIVIGEADRAFSSELALELRQKDFAVVADGDSIYALGGCFDKTMAAVDYLVDAIEEGGKDGIAIDPDEPYYALADYPVRSVYIDGVNLRNYTIIMPKVSNYYIYFTAELLNKFLLTNVGYTLARSSDDAEEGQYEILIGSTNRAASKTDAEFAADEYSLAKVGDKIVCLGSNQFVAGGISDILRSLPETGTNQKVEITGFAESVKPEKFEFCEAESAILLIGDGMGFNSILATEIAGRINSFSAKTLPIHGSAKTNSLSGTTDSAASGTALATGYKTVNGYLGVDKDNKPVLSVRALADSVGANTAILTTDAITGATPSAFMVHHKNRNDTSIIQGQIDILLNDRSIDYAKGSVGNNLLTETKDALELISKNGERFFMMIEEGYIDKNSHSNNFDGMFDAIARFDRVILYVSVFTVLNPETVMIVTADHETGGITCSVEWGAYRYTSTSHTAADVPIYAMGAGAEFFAGDAVENVEIPKFIAKIFGEEVFGQ